jgi:predicted enzyme related to lactoylglutathione lyase
MSERQSYPPGTFCWVDLGTPDLERAGSFYGDLFGWTVPEGENSGHTGGYRQAELGGRPVAGVMPLMQEGQPPSWSTYIAVEDAEETAGRVRDAGGTVIAEPMDVLELGRMALFTDPTGAFFGIWQAGTFAGAAVVKETGGVVWNELNTRDPERARVFYAEVFGWSFEDREFDTGNYTTLEAGGETIGGMLDITGRVPEEVPAHWLVYFASEDVDASLEKLKASGGSVAFGPQDISEVGRIAVVHDPSGAHFALIQPDPQMGASSAS